MLLVRQGGPYEPPVPAEGHGPEFHSPPRCNTAPVGAAPLRAMSASAEHAALQEALGQLAHAGRNVAAALAAAADAGDSAARAAAEASAARERLEYAVEATVARRASELLHLPVGPRGLEIVRPGPPSS